MNWFVIQREAKLMSRYNEFGESHESARRRNDYWAAKREAELEEKARNREALERFMGMLGPIGTLK